MKAKAVARRCAITRFFTSIPVRLLLVFFALGMVLRAPVFFEDHNEGDEVIYGYLVDQLEEGRGYTLQGTDLIEYGVLDANTYGRKLFFHPPGGIALFWLFDSVMGGYGLPMAQIFCFGVFFWAMVASAYLLGLPPLAVALTGLLSAVNPILVHVSTHYWLDGPIAAFSSLSLALFILALNKKSAVTAAAAGAILGFASLIKITAFFVVPGFVLLAYFLLARPRLKDFVLLSACFLMAAFIVQLPWELWQLEVLGTPFPGWAGRPSQALIESNTYVRYLTVVRSPWIYLTLLPKVMWTAGPALVLYFLSLSDRKTAGPGAAFILWIAVVLGFHIALGAQGYSKVLRYVILAVPPAILLFSMTVPLMLKRYREGSSRWLYAILLAFSALAVALEAAAGVKSALLYSIDLIFPLFGGL